MEAVISTEMSINFYQTILRNIPEDSHLQYAQSVLISSSILIVATE
jgi:hypothetical protein